MIPLTYESWKQCIIHDCKITLTRAFVEQRLSIYSDDQHTETKKFKELYGRDHLQNVIHWYQRVLNEV